MRVWLGFYLRRGYFTLRRRMAAALDGGPITVEQYSLLAVLGEDDGVRQQELSERLVSDPNSIARLVRVLEEQGWLARQTDPADSRAQLVRLTARGRRVRERALVHARALRAEAVEGISDVDLETARRVLDRIHRNLVGP